MSNPPYSRATTAISEITGQPVSTWSEEWQHECEARTVLAMSKAERDAFFNGSTDEDGKRKERGIIAIRGQKAAETLRGNMERLMAARTRKP
ncbi:MULTISPECIES: DUF7696 family protein [Microvirga]|uniref:DUF7696 family protein n=1 Tax=Microvirga TaxID=186650 RepID=UPI001CFFB266|nr:hypothetical protein [Microvirga lenta]MCB5177058.1 hypothetical protein [Microvirga lenta]